MTEPLNLDPAMLLGQRAPIVYGSILLAHAETSAVTLCRYLTPPLLQQRVEMTRYEQSIVDAALEIRESTKLPFWEAIFCACLCKGECRDSLLDATLFHSGLGKTFEYHRKDIESGILSKIAADEIRNVGLSSEVKLATGDRRHLMLVDFHCRVTEDNSKLVHRVCRRLMPKGFVILDSGDSYHASSLALGTNEERIKLLGRALLLAPIVDSTYIAHQLQQDASSIRISRGGKSDQFPIAVDVYPS